MDPKIPPEKVLQFAFCFLSQEMRHTTIFLGPKGGVVGGGGGKVSVERV